jgi:hypothetical protein
VLRFLIGGLFFAHGAQKVLGMWGGLGPGATAENLRGYGFVAQADPLSWALGIAELAAGAFVVLGLLTPLAAAGLVAIKIVAVAVKWGTVPLYAAAAPDAWRSTCCSAAGRWRCCSPGRADRARPRPHLAAPPAALRLALPRDRRRDRGGGVLPAARVSASPRNCARTTGRSPGCWSRSTTAPGTGSGRRG